MSKSLIRYNQLQQAKSIIEASINNDDIEAALDEYGFGLDRLIEGKILLEETEKVHYLIIDEKILNKELIVSLKKLQEHINERFLVHFEQACVVLANHKEAVVSMKLQEERRESFVSWLEQVKAFYLNALLNSDILSLLQSEGINQQEIEELILLINTFEDTYDESLQKKGAVIKAHRRIRFLFKKLNEWVDELKMMAKIAFKTSPRVLREYDLV
ncbi:hypothetical protein [Sediminitomix flava]|uniref:Uncharacterized protein n=1 Tax=Sediminitomix flava TaxID=379075 RepID=A0A315Z722_SEDFL|nr:hypothetical protein [Sediminitomix flava]PWJ38471.1 hypothetical protein BC781_10761 [Sediminitomix flava]